MRAPATVNASEHSTTFTSSRRRRRVDFVRESSEPTFLDPLGTM
jgi:hypothetical protein